MFLFWILIFILEVQFLGDLFENDIWICCLILYVIIVDVFKEVIICCRLIWVQLVRGDLVQIRRVRCVVQEIFQYNVEGVLEWCYICVWFSVNDFWDDVVDNDLMYFDVVV